MVTASISLQNIHETDSESYSQINVTWEKFLTHSMQILARKIGNLGKKEVFYHLVKFAYYV